MPELPDIVVYVESIDARVTGRRLAGVRVASPFVLRTVEPALEAFAGRRVEAVSRMGKRIVLHLEDELALVIHLMIAGRLEWRPPGAAIPRGRGLAAFDFDPGTVVLTEASKKKRASLHAVRGAAALAALDPAGLEVLEATPERFAAALTAHSHTLKRALTDPRILSGIGNAYSDEILHRARLSPFKLTTALTAPEMERLYRATRGILAQWLERLREDNGDGFPRKVTAFRDGMAVHGRYGRPCPECGTAVQRIVYAQNEANYCPRCQTEGRMLADRSLSRLLKRNWPRTVDELERGA